MMLHLQSDNTCPNYIGISVKTFRAILSAVAVIVIPMLIMLFIVTFALKSTYIVQIIYIDRCKLATHRTSHKFLSIALDSSVIAEDFHNFNTTNVKLIKMMRYLHPAYLRVGGNLADKLYFSPDLTEPDESVTSFYKKMTLNGYADLKFAPNYTMTGNQWLKLVKLAYDTDLDIFFDLNALIRFSNGTWDYRNAETLIDFSYKHRLNVNWELGNEPNAFRHEFNEVVNATQMAADFGTLRRILAKYPKYNKSLLVGPDTTRPLENNRASEKYLRRFLKNGVHYIDAITWHQYYLSGRTAEPKDFLNPEVFDLLKTQIQTVHNITKSAHAWNKPIWLGETSSAYGGGAPNLSDTFIGSFIWVDKLGLAAKMGIEVVMRQSIFSGHYALLDDEYNPNPDWWISVLYKKLVGTRVVPYYTACSTKVRLYCHCTKHNIFAGDPPSITVFGVNMGNSTVNVRIEGLMPDEQESEPLEQTLLSTIYAFEITSKSLFSKSIYLNGELLKMAKDNVLPKFEPKEERLRPFVTMPPFSIVFWVIPSPYVEACLV